MTSCSTSPRFFRRGWALLVIVTLQYVTYRYVEVKRQISEGCEAATIKTPHPLRTLRKGRGIQRWGVGKLVGRERLVASLVVPKTNMIFHKEPLRRSLHKLGFERKCVGFQGNREMHLCIDEAADEEFAVTIQPENLKLDGMHKRVKQRSLREF